MLYVFLLTSHRAQETQSQEKHTITFDGHLNNTVPWKIPLICFGFYFCIICSQQVSAGAQEQLETKDRLIQKLAANNKEKDNLIAVK